MRCSSSCALWFALLVLLGARSALAGNPLDIAVTVPGLRERLEADPDVLIVAPERAAVLLSHEIPSGGGELRGAVIVLEERGGAAMGMGIRSMPGPLRKPQVVSWRGPTDHPLARLQWRSCPRAAVRPVRVPQGFRVLARAGHQPLLVEGQIGSLRILVWTAPLRARANTDLAAWPLMGYVLHAATMRAAGRAVAPFAEWRAAPVPGQRTVVAIAAALLLLWPLTLAAFRRARRAGPPSPEALLRYSSPSARSSDWRDPSFARPLAGFFLFLAGSILLLAPYFWLVGVVVPNHVQPFPQADGIWDAVAELFQVAFFLFDFATNTAFVRFFAATRVREPSRALRYAQLFLWWQVLSGLLQVTGVALLVLAGPLSASTYAFYGFFLLIHGAVQFPGLFGVAYHILQGSQRFDYAAIVDVLEKRIFKILIPIPFVLLLREWGRAHPAYGEVFGAVIGLGIGAYVAQWLTLLVGIVLCRRAGLPVRPLFGASFTRAEVRDVFSYGAKAIIGQIAFRAANSVEILVLAALLSNYTEWLGIWGLLQSRFSYLVLLAYGFFDSGVPVFGEALAAGKRALAQYLVARFLQFAVLWGAVVFAILAALGPGFIRGALDPQWHRAADLVVIAAFARALACAGWVSDALQRGANWPMLFSWVLTGEQLLRLGLFFVLIPEFQVAGLFAAVIVSLALKTVVAWWLNHLLIVPFRLSVWQSLGAPVATGAILFVVLAVISSSAAGALGVGAQALFYGGAIVAIVTSMLLLGALGGLDGHALDEINRAARMTSLLSPVARILSGAARLGARISPLHGRFPQPAAHEALAQAKELEAEGETSRSQG